MNLLNYDVTYANGEVATLPVTDNELYPTLGGYRASGLEFEVRPGIGGWNLPGLLNRTDTVEIDAIFDGRFEWQTRSATIWVRDQNGVPIEGSAVNVLNYDVTYANGEVATLPVTDNTLYPNLGGLRQDGLEIQVRPAIGGMNLPGLLNRVDTVEIDATFDGRFEWQTRSATIWVRDQNGEPIEGSAVNVLNYDVTYANGEVATLPVTDSTLYPNLGGLRQDGLEILVRPAIGGVNNYHLLNRTDTVEIDDAFDGGFEWQTRSATIWVKDQNGVPIEGSAVYVTNYGVTYQNGEVATLPVTDNDLYPTLGGGWATGLGMQVWPGVGGAANHNLLNRYETVEIDGSFDGQFEWWTHSATIWVKDQNGVPIEGSAVYVTNYGVTYQNGEVATLPVTDNDRYPTLGGSWASGLGMRVWPGIGGIANHNLLNRYEAVEIDDAFDGQFEWRTHSATVWVRDQNGVPIDGSFVRVNSGNSWFANGEVATLPVTDEELYPTLGGSWGTGLGMVVCPGIGGVGNSNLLNRYELVEIDDAFDGQFEWWMADCPVVLVDGQESVVFGSHLRLLGVNHENWSRLFLPITDLATYPSTAGAFASGYQITLFPADTPDSGTFAFRVLATGEFDPPFVAMAGNTYGLRCRPNQPPTVASGGPYSVNEGGTVTVSATGSDPNEGDTLTYAWDLDGDGSFESPGQTLEVSATGLDDGDLSLEVQVTDSGGLTAIDSTVLTVLNAPPVVGEISAPVDPVLVGTEIVVSVAFSDPGVLDTHTAMIDWGDDTMSDGTVSEAGGAGQVLGAHTYAAAGVYTLYVNLWDDDHQEDGDGNVLVNGEAEAVYRYVVVYDPEGDFVTGGGWIDSPAGAYVLDPLLTGKASFGFVSKYQKGADVPSGQTEFRFKAADLDFHSDSYQWLVVAGAKAQFKGWGKINGQGDFGFLLTSKDSAINGGGEEDTFRIKIWDAASELVIYDNQLGEADDASPSTALGGGSIVIHKQ